MADLNKLAGVLSGQKGGVLSQYAGAPKTYAQGALNFLRNIPNALFSLGQGQAYGTADPNNPVSDLEREKFWRGSVMGIPEDVQQRNYQRALAVALAAPTVYHGSPHKFDKFDSSKIGTGEGAQAYGHGLYFAENPGVAKEYAKSNQGRAAAKDGLIDALPKNMQMDVYKAMQMTDGPFKDATIADVVSRFPESAPVFASKNATLYKVDLPDAMASKMLDWDKPLSQQPKSVQAALAKLDKETYHPRGGDYDANELGQQTYQRLLRTYGESKVSAMLPGIGVPGIRYLDQGSRGAGQGTSNYVVFPGMEDALKILERK